MSPAPGAVVSIERRLAALEAARASHASPANDGHARAVASARARRTVEDGVTDPRQFALDCRAQVDVLRRTILAWAPLHAVATSRGFRPFGEVWLVGCPPDVLIDRAATEHLQFQRWLTHSTTDERLAYAHGDSARLRSVSATARRSAAVTQIVLGAPDALPFRKRIWATDADGAWHMNDLVEWNVGTWFYDDYAHRYRLRRAAVRHSPEVFDALLELGGKVSDAAAGGEISLDASFVSPVSVAKWILDQELKGPGSIPTWSKSVRFGQRQRRSQPVS